MTDTKDQIVFVGSFLLWIIAIASVLIAGPTLTTVLAATFSSITLMQSWAVAERRYW